MKAIEVKEQETRIAHYRAMEKERNELYTALSLITEPWKETGPCGQGPFTGNTRETRRIKAVHIWFTRTLGGAPEVDTRIYGLNISAREVGTALQSIIQSRIDDLTAAMDKL